MRKFIDKNTKAVSKSGLTRVFIDLILQEAGYVYSNFSNTYYNPLTEDIIPVSDIYVFINFGIEFKHKIVFL